MPQIGLDRRSAVTAPLQMKFKKQVLSIGTGFYYERNSQKYLITNWHNVSGRNPQTLAPLSSTSGLPDRLSLPILKTGDSINWVGMDQELYFDSQEENPTRPRWLEHPSYKNRVDVVAIPFAPPEGTEVHVINTAEHTEDMMVAISDDVFVLGYPKGIIGGGAFPIWKRASIATEPDINQDNLPKMLIDTATREGMSGSPVIAISKGGYRTISGNQVIGKDGSKFVGVYSGRLGSDEMQAQLGIVWKAEIIDEIIDGNQLGKSSFEL
jgi:hypothetical protein